MLPITRLLFFGFLADQEELSRVFASEENPQVSAVKYQTALLEGLAINGAEVSILSTLPISSFPKNRKLFVRSKKFTLSERAPAGLLMGFINLPVVKLACRLATSLFSGFVVLRRNHPTSAILIYSAHTPFLLASIILKRILGTRLVVIIPDLPLHMAGKPEAGIRGVAKRFDDRLLKALVGSADLVVPITADIVTDWLPTNSRYLVVEGVAPLGDRTLPARKEVAIGQRKRLVYAGTFSHIEKFARMFSSNKDIDAEIIFLGGGPEGEVLKSLALDDYRIVVKPFKHGADYEKEMASADFLLNPRDTEWHGSKYSFPSKLFEYMLMNRPILSTRMRGIPEEYFDCFLTIDDTEPDLFRESFITALSCSPAELKKRISKGRDMALNDKSPTAVGARLLNAIAK
jgi:glycosyltransferase involved in cell wall biosynthesis